MKQIIVYGAILLGASITMSHAQTSDADSPTADANGPLYDVRGIVDPGLGGIVAYAVKVPHGWGLQQSATREPTGGAVLHFCLYERLDSPDGHSIIEVLPERCYDYASAPNILRFNAQQAAAGHGDPGFIPPMTPLEYLKKMILPRYAKQCGVPYTITEQKDQPIPRGGGNAFGYVICKFDDGRKVGIDAKINYIMGQIQGGVHCGWAPTCCFTQSSDEAGFDRATTYRFELSRSQVMNQVWARQMEEMDARALEQNQRVIMARLDGMAKQFQRNVQNQHAISESINSNFRQHMRATDQVTQAFCDYLGDNVLLENPSTGARLRTTNDASHYYQDNGGSLYKSNAPLNGNGINFPELQQVEIRNYSR